MLNSPYLNLKSESEKMANNNLTSDAFWLKTLYLILFYTVYRVLDIVILLIVVVQWGFELLSGEPNPSLRAFSASLAAYVQQIIAYLGSADEQKPYPFTDWPSQEK